MEIFENLKFENPNAIRRNILEMIPSDISSTPRTALMSVLSLTLACGDSGRQNDDSFGAVSSPTSPVTTVDEAGTDHVLTEGNYPTGTASDGDSNAFPNCGDGIVNTVEGEECDQGKHNGNDKYCTESCQVSYCGDGLVAPGEGCDDGDENSKYGPCTQECKLVSCGDGMPDPGEQCDGGLKNADESYCTKKCTLSTCEDGLVGPGETCDDQNHDPNDGCDECKSTTCGDGFVDPGENCDDGDKDNSDFCTTICKSPSCVDGILSGKETDLDCGGDDCAPCVLDSQCVNNNDCGEGQCITNMCQIADSCDTLLDLDTSLKNGIYLIDVDEAGPKPPFKVYCNMETQGGGWTGVMFVNGENFDYDDQLWVNYAPLYPDNFNFDESGGKAKWISFVQVPGTEIMSCQLENFNVCYKATPPAFTSAQNLFSEVAKDGYEIEKGYVQFFDDMAPADAKRKQQNGCTSVDSVGINQQAYLTQGQCDQNNGGARFGQRVYSNFNNTIGQGWGAWATHNNSSDTSQILFVR